MIYAVEGYMRGGMTHNAFPVVSTHECEVGQGMSLASIHLMQLEVSRGHNRRVIVDYNPCKKHKNFDLNRFYSELEKGEVL